MGYRVDFSRSYKVDLVALSGKEMDNLRGRLNRAAERGVRVFDAYAHSKTTTHPPISARVRYSRVAGTLTLAVSGAAPSLRYVRASPSLDVDTTGSKRQPVTVTGWTGLTVPVPRGFIWNGIILQRRETGRKLDNAKFYLMEHGALPTPAEILARCAGSVVEEVEKVLGQVGVSYE